MAGSATRRWRAPGTHAASVCAVPRWQELQRPPETCGTVAFLQLWTATLRHRPSSWSEAHLGSDHPAPRGAMRGGLGSLWQGRRSLLGGSVTRAGLIIHTFEGSGEPRTCFPLVFWRITKALGPAGQVACSSQEACALLGRWARRPCRLRPELGPPALRRPEPAPWPLRVHLRAQGSLSACALFYLRAQCSASPLRRRLL